MVKAKLYRENHTQKHTHTHSQKEKQEKIYIYLCSQNPPPQFGMIRCLFRYSTDAGTSGCLWKFNPLLLRLLGEISLSLLCSHSSRGSALDLDPPLRVGRLRASVLRSDRTGLKEQLIRGLWLTQARGREGYGCRASLQRQRPAWCCTSLRHAASLNTLTSWESSLIFLSLSFLIYIMVMIAGFSPDLQIWNEAVLVKHTCLAQGRLVEWMLFWD